MLAELRINRNPVSQNRKCEGCCHYDGNAISKGGACEVGTQPAMCGSGTEPRFGYAPLIEMSPGMVDVYARPATSGSPGVLNEHGKMDGMIQMQTVDLGSEQLATAAMVKNKLTDMQKGCTAETIGQTSRFSPEGHVDSGPQGVSTLDIAKSMYTSYMRPREQFKFSLKEVLQFLGENGYTVTDEELKAAGE